MGPRGMEIGVEQSRIRSLKLILLVLLCDHIQPGICERTLPENKPTGWRTWLSTSPPPPPKYSAAQRFGIQSGEELKSSATLPTPTPQKDEKGNAKVSHPPEPAPEDRAAILAKEAALAGEKEPWWEWAQPRFGDSVNVTTSGGRVLSRHQKARQKNLLMLAKKWLECHRRLRKEVKVADKGEGWDVLMLGSSLMESWRGTMMNDVFPGYDNIRRIWTRYFAGAHTSEVDYSAHVLAVAGDMVPHMMWRILHGCLPRWKPPKVLLIQVGMHDVALPDGCNTETAERVGTQVIQMVQYVRQRLPKTYIVVMGILPKGEAWPNVCTPATDLANNIIRYFAEGPAPGSRTGQPDPRLTFVDFGHVFLRDASAQKLDHALIDKGRILRGSEAGSKKDGVKRFHLKLELMPDTMHPNAAGMEVLALELEPFIGSIVQKYDAEFGLAPAGSRNAASPGFLVGAATSAPPAFAIA